MMVVMRMWIGVLMLVACDQGAKPKPVEQPNLAAPKSAACVPASTWTPIATENAPPPNDRVWTLWTGDRLIVHEFDGAKIVGGIFDPCANRWTKINESGMPAPTTGEEPQLAGPYVVWPFPDGKLARIYDTQHDTWREIAFAAPMTASRRGTSVSWTGKEVILFGGITADYNAAPGGVRIDPATGAVHALPTANEPAARTGAGLVWLADRLVLWGGCESLPNCTTPANGATYDPKTDTWRPMPPAPKNVQLAGVAGDRVVIYGAEGGALYDPRTDKWTTIPSTEPHGDWRVHGDYLVASGLDNTLVYSIADNAWKSVPTPPRGDRINDSYDYMIGVPTHDVRVHLDLNGAGADIWLLDPSVPTWNHTHIAKYGPAGLRAVATVLAGKRLVAWTLLRRIHTGNGCEGVQRPCDPVDGFREEPTAEGGLIDLSF